MAKVTLLDFTGKGRPDEGWHAADLLIFTKGTRLGLTPERFSDVQEMSRNEKMTALQEMAKTIPSSWEFADVAFLIEGATRATAQQITRTRTGSYSMQSQRIVDMSDAEVVNPFDHEGLKDMFDEAAEASLAAYAMLIANGAEAQEARGILPLNVTSNLLAKYNLRAFIDLVRSRSSLRTQGEYAAIIRLMVDEVIAAWPWVRVFLERPGDISIQILESVAASLGITPGSGPGWQIAKAIDLLRGGE